MAGLKLNPQNGLAMPDYSTLGGYGAPPAYTGLEMAPANYNIAAPVPPNYTGVPGLTAPTSGFWSAQNNSVLTGGGAAGTTPGWLQTMRDWGILGSTDKNGIQQQGWGGLALGAAQGLGSLYMGMKQYELAKDTLATNKAQFERQFAANKQLTNSNLEDRQRARVASNAGAYQSVGDYMAQNGVK